MPKTPAKPYYGINQRDTDFEKLRARLKLKILEVQKEFAKNFPEVDSYLKEKGLELGRIRINSAKIIGAGALTGSLLLAPATGVTSLPSPQEVFAKLTDTTKSEELPQKSIIDILNQFLPDRPRPLTRNEEKLLEEVFNSVIGVKTNANLDGEHLNTSYGFIGAEQHLKRYPGDTLYNHGEGDVIKEGIAPGLGAWGYFAKSEDQFTPQLEETERWYAVVQTLYLPDWNTRQPYLRDWYKYRKVLIVNTQNGNAVVAAIADSGPAAWTGKHYGGSPEVMEYLGGPRYKKGAVLVFFVDDPENKVPLGPVEYNKISLPGVSLAKI